MDNISYYIDTENYFIPEIVMNIESVSGEKKVSTPAPTIQLLPVLDTTLVSKYIEELENFIISGLSLVAYENNTDPLLMKKIKVASDMKNMILQQGENNG
jgi:hypothetical protein